MCLQKYSDGTTKRLLELACGTGNHAFELEKYDYKIVATDYSDDMLACSRKKAVEKGSSIDFRLQDMRKLDIEEKPFDAVICLFDSIGYVKTNDALSRVFQGVNRHLRTGGLFLFEFLHASAMVKAYDPVRVRRWSLGNTELIRISETNLDYLNQLVRVEYTIYGLRDDGTYLKLVETQFNMFFLLQEMAEKLLAHGFYPVKWFAGFNENENINDKTWHIIALANKE